MRVIPADVSAATLLVTKLPEVKVKDRQTGEIAVDPVTNDRLMALELVFIAAGGSDMNDLRHSARCRPGSMRVSTPPRWLSAQATALRSC